MILVALTSVLAASPLFIENVRVEVGDGTSLKRATVVVEGAKIVRIEAEPPADATDAVRIDGSGKVLTPGLVDSGSRLGLSEVEAEASTNDHRYNGMELAPGFRAADGFNPSSMWIPIERSQGVTSVVIRPSGSVLSGSGSWVDLTGALQSVPDAKQPSAMFAAVGASATERVGGSRGGVWLRLREALADARFYGKNKLAVEQNRARALSLSPVHLEALLPVAEGRMPLIVEAHRASDILQVLAFAREEKLRVAIEGGAEAYRVAVQLAQANVPVILTPSDQMPTSFDKVGARDDAARLLDEAGVRLIIASDGMSRRIRQEAGIAAAYGLSRARAIRAITQAPAELYGHTDTGVVGVGKRANLVLWSGDPLELSSRAEKVFIDGVEQSPDHRQRRLLERYRRR